MSRRKRGKRGRKNKGETPQMPWEFRGRLNTLRIVCGICQRRERFPRPFSDIKEARAYAMGLGWTYLQDLGWACPCRRRCGNLPLDRKTERTPGGRRHGTKPGKRAHQERVRRIINRRRRQEIE